MSIYFSAEDAKNVFEPVLKRLSLDSPDRRDFRLVFENYTESSSLGESEEEARLARVAGRAALRIFFPDVHGYNHPTQDNEANNNHLEKYDNFPEVLFQALFVLTPDHARTKTLFDEILKNIEDFDAGLLKEFTELRDYKLLFDNWVNRELIHKKTPEILKKFPVSASFEQFQRFVIDFKDTTEGGPSNDRILFIHQAAYLIFPKERDAIRESHCFFQKKIHRRTVLQNMDRLDCWEQKELPSILRAIITGFRYNSSWMNPVQLRKTSENINNLSNKIHEFFLSGKFESKAENIILSTLEKVMVSTLRSHEQGIDYDAYVLSLFKKPSNNLQP